ncbi:proteasome subunit beta [archaeon]|nr:proteasome subunit beta [archaeon]
MNQELSHKTYKTGTTTLGIVCKDGVLLAADRRVTAGFVAHKKFKKIVQIEENMAVTTAGSVSEAQLLSKLIRAELSLKNIQTNRKSTAKEVANLLAGLVYSNVRQSWMFQSIAAFLLAAKDDEGFYLYSLGPDGSLIQHEDYAFDGSGEMFAIGVLESHFKKGMTVSEAIKVAVKAINAAIQRDIYTGNGIDIITVTEKGLEWVKEEELIYSLKE